MRLAPLSSFSVLRAGAADEGLVLGWSGVLPNSPPPGASDFIWSTVTASVISYAGGHAGLA
jgi:hypothetical protein